MDFKRKEIQEYFDEFIKSYPWSEEDDIMDDAMNMGEYYIIGRQRAIEWCGDKAFDIIECVKDYEEEDGDVITDLSNPEEVVHSYVLIIGGEIIKEYLKNKKLGRTVSGIICNECELTLPPHTIKEHVNKDDPIHTCPHNQKDSENVKVFLDIKM